jgi:hypothetical protein
MSKSFLVPFLEKRTLASHVHPIDARATSAALMPPSARLQPEPSSIMRRSFWVRAIRVERLDLDVHAGTCQWLGAARSGGLGVAGD